MRRERRRLRVAASKGIVGGSTVEVAVSVSGDGDGLGEVFLFFAGVIA